MRRAPLYFAASLFLFIAPACPPESLLELCSNGTDDNGDGLADCDDPTCATVISCRDEICNNNIDDNGNGLTDCDEDGCADDSSCISFCGDGVVQSTPSGEECDSGDLNGQDCGDFGLANGNLLCDDFCQFDTSSCQQVTCGNGALDGSEECDGADLDGESCESLGLGSGPLSCAGNCVFDESGCALAPPEICDNELDDDSDGDADCADSECANVPDVCFEDTCDDASDNDQDGDTDCDDADCGLAAGCVANAVCGDGAVNQGSEQCDGADLENLNCQSFGFNTGSISCSGTCQIVTSGCSNVEVCNNGSDDDGDGLADCSDPNCATAPNCPRCGDGAINQGTEQCDGSALGGQTCVGLGFDGGTLACNGSCQFNTGACTNAEDCAVAGDEDGDGQADCADSDCAAAPSCQAAGDCTTPFTTQSAVPFNGNTSTTTDTGDSDDCGFFGVCCFGGGFPDATFVLSSTTTRGFTAVLSSSVDMGMYAREDCGDSGSQFACVDNQFGGVNETISDTVFANNPVFITVDGFDGAGAFTLTITLQ